MLRYSSRGLIAPATEIVPDKLGSAKSMLCSRCDATSPLSSRRCDGSGALLQPCCPSCGDLTRASARFRNGCGRAQSPEGPVETEDFPPLPAALAALPASRHARESERKQDDVLFAVDSGLARSRAGAEP